MSTSINTNTALAWKSSFQTTVSFNGVPLPFKPKPPLTKFSLTCSAASSSDPLLVKAARGDPVSRPPAWMMRQEGRYMAVYRKLAEKYPSFRERLGNDDNSGQSTSSLFVCAVCQVDLTPSEGISVHSGSIFSTSSKPWQGPFLCSDCRDKKDAMEGKRPSGFEVS